MIWEFMFLITASSKRCRKIVACKKVAKTHPCSFEQASCWRPDFHMQPAHVARVNGGGRAHERGYRQHSPCVRMQPRICQDYARRGLQQLSRIVREVGLPATGHPRVSLYTQLIFRQLQD